MLRALELSALSALPTLVTGDNGPSEVREWNIEKGFGFIVPVGLKEGEEARRLTHHSMRHLVSLIRISTTTPSYSVVLA